MRRAALSGAVLAGILLASATASAEWRFRLPRRGRGDAIENIAMPEILPGDTLRYLARNPGTGAVFARYESDLLPGAALESAGAALAGEGWRQVISMPSISLFENSAGLCAVVQALPAPGGSSVAVLVQRAAL